MIYALVCSPLISHLCRLQEVQDLSGASALLTDEEKGRQWSKVIQCAVSRTSFPTRGLVVADPTNIQLGCPKRFRCVAVRQMVGM